MRAVAQLRALERGQIPWRKLWHPDPNRGGPTRVVSGIAYQGIDYLTLQLAMEERNHLGRWWGTGRQWKSLGGTLRSSAGVEITGRHLVFNIDQVEGKRLNKFRPNIDHTALVQPDYKSAQGFVKATKADIRFSGDSEAFYCRPTPDLLWPHHVDGDYILIPPMHVFIDSRSYFETIFHELIHWSEVRRNWKGDCAEGEMISEIGSCFIANELNIPHSDDFTNHLKYVDEWMREMKRDSSYIFRAASEASKACHYILSLRK